jgi:hypothetical protein
MAKVSSDPASRVLHDQRRWSILAAELAGGRGQDGTVDLPLLRRSITPRALTWKSRQQPSSRRIDAADRLFSVSLTRITSVPECAVSSVGFLWGSAAVSLSCGVSVGLAPKPLTGLADPARVPKSRRLPDPNDHFPVTQCYQGDLAGCSNFAPIAESMRPPGGRISRIAKRRFPVLVRWVACLIGGAWRRSGDCGAAWLLSRQRGAS